MNLILSEDNGRNIGELDIDDFMGGEEGLDAQAVGEAVKSLLDDWNEEQIRLNEEDLKKHGPICPHCGKRKKELT